MRFVRLGRATCIVGLTSLHRSKQSACLKKWQAAHLLSIFAICASLGDKAKVSVKEAVGTWRTNF